MSKITPVILSGGAGTRLWPISHSERPKQLLPLLGTERTLLQETALRTADPARFEPPIVVTSDRHAHEVEAQLTRVGVRPSQIILEPAGRNTAAAVTLAALRADPGAILLVMPSDHAIRDVGSFLGHVSNATPLARQMMLVTFGITPVRPETGYGYIKVGEALNDGHFRADRFVEKPDLATAAHYIAEGNFLWNAGIFMFEAAAFLQAVRIHAPNVLKIIYSSLESVQHQERHVRPDPVSFGSAPALSVDHAIMERSDNVAVVPVEIGWSDVGSWDALYELGAKDESGNLIAGHAFSLDARACLLRTDGPTLVAVEVENLVVVATERAVLVIPRGRTQRVKEALEQISASS
jgi:mannose-1-phosphate guanylyltransferase/mannose-1-phosphate guanylyltransferase/mannose-6-phosphate isomerase